MTIAQEMMKKRKSLKLSQRELANRCNIPQSTIGRIEAGTVTPSLHILQKLANELDVEISISDKKPTSNKWEGLEIMCFWNDELVAFLRVTNNKAKIQRFSKHPVKQIFFDDEMDVYRLSTVLESRCWQRDCRNIDRYLEKLDVKYYDPLEIVKKTHGVSYNDFFWFRFNGEELTWKDVAPARLRNV